MWSTDHVFDDYYMILPWREFRVYLPAFKAWLDANYPNTDGLMADSVDMEIVEREPLTEAEQDDIEAYWLSLTGPVEEAKFARPGRIIQATYWMKDQIILKSWKDTTALERKLVCLLPLSTMEEDELLSLWEASL